MECQKRPGSRAASAEVNSPAWRLNQTFNWVSMNRSRIRTATSHQALLPSLEDQ
jgi:hypothetical protein